ncbi:hypothetical protein [Halomarina litorea]|uniref:hypothetical protein n=1 Tax=Halomarina litorea TaxID=2961595 RepID=UPI0020C29E13|nr:hypothetical protein [Halomarina sp. BCD28]
MGFYNHNHKHQWERLGVVHDEYTSEIQVIYQCTDCSCWSSLELDDLGEVPFRGGTLANEGGDR